MADGPGDRHRAVDVRHAGPALAALLVATLAGEVGARPPGLTPT